MVLYLLWSDNLMINLLSWWFKPFSKIDFFLVLSPPPPRSLFLLYLRLWLGDPEGLSIFSGRIHFVVLPTIPRVPVSFAPLTRFSQHSLFLPFLPLAFLYSSWKKIDDLSSLVFSFFRFPPKVLDLSRARHAIPPVFQAVSLRIKWLLRLAIYRDKKRKQITWR